tara:strand:+ start:365 stop:730 length:366 start_codon:yes stop_codon:yes gene_type:complete
MEAIKAAFGAVRLVFVGPQCQQGQLEKAALKIGDLRLRPEVVHNFLQLDVDHQSSPSWRSRPGDPPTLAQIRELFVAHGGIVEHMKMACRVTDEQAIDVELRSQPSDTAAVCLQAQSPVKP